MSLSFKYSLKIYFYVLYGALTWDSYNEKFKVLEAGESGIYRVCLFNHVKAILGT